MDDMHATMYGLQKTTADHQMVSPIAKYVHLLLSL